MRLTVPMIVFSAVVAPLAWAAPAPVSLMPEVKEVTWGEALSIEGKGVIELGPQASSPEKHAARMLAQSVKRRFGVEWAVETGTASQAAIRVLIGSPKKYPALEKLCAQHKLPAPAEDDGYAVGVAAEGSGVVAFVAADNDRGTLYGQDTLLQLLGEKGKGLAIHGAAIRDWPTIPMRGRPHPHYEYFFKTENFDTLLTSRLNYIDIRDGIYAFEPGAKLKHEELKKVIADARERGLIVFAVINCGVKATEYDAVMASFKEFLDMGCNALWLSYDDKGPGEKPREITERVLALGRERGINGDRITITPPKGAYQVMGHKFNREIAAVPGMETALWFITSVPCAEDLAAAKEIGLKVPPSWWHNWPRYRDNSFASAKAGRPYNPVISMADGWNHPTDKELTEAGQYVRGILPWDGWQMQQDYLLPVIGWWSWRPEKHDYAAVRRRIYADVFGPAQASAAMAFDDTLNAVHARFRIVMSDTGYSPLTPPMLRSIEERPRILARIEEMAKSLSVLQGSSKGSIIARPLLEEQYLSPMAMEVKGAKAAATAPYPEYWWEKHQAALLDAVYDRQMDKAEQLIAKAREKVAGDLETVEAAYGDARELRGYAAWWKKEAGRTAGEWAQMREKRHAELLEHVADYTKTVAPFDKMMAAYDDPPVQMGTGAWRRHNHVLATLLPEGREYFWGGYLGGVIEKNNRKVICFALERHANVNEGSFSSLQINVPISGRRDRLALLLYVADVNKESFGLGYAKWRWAGSRSISLHANGQAFWKADLGIPRPQGEWILVPLPTQPEDVKTLPVRVRVEDHENAKNNFTIVYLGPIHLLEMDRD